VASACAEWHTLGGGRRFDTLARWAVRIEPVRRVLDAADLVLLKLAAGGVLDRRDAAALLATDREHLIATVEARLATAAIGPDAVACWQQVLALPV